MTEEEIDAFYDKVRVLKLRPTNVATVWVLPDQQTLRSVPARAEMRPLTVEMAEETLERLKKSLELTD